MIDELRVLVEAVPLGATPAPGALRLVPRRPRALAGLAVRRHLRCHWREYVAVGLVLVGGLSIDLVGSYPGGLISGFGACWLLNLWVVY